MKRTQVIIPWKEGLHMRPAARLVTLAKASKSSIWLKMGAKVADARSILAILLLCAAAGAVVDLEITGEDEESTFRTVTQVFHQDATPDDVDEIEVEPSDERAA